MRSSSEEYHAALASPARRKVLDALLRSPEPLDAATVAERLGLHVTTARFHLEQLATAGLAARRAGAEARRGRPRMLYAPAGRARDENAREQLIGVLASALAGDESPAAESTEAGRRWAAALGPIPLGEPRAGLVNVLDRLGFEPETEPGVAGDRDLIRLRACPFRAPARDHPEVVCSVHRGLIDQLLGGTGTGAQLLPFVQPDLCVVAFEPPEGTVTE